MTQLYPIVYDSILDADSNNEWEAIYYNWTGKFKSEVNNIGIPALKKDYANRANRRYDLTVEKEKLTGIYFNKNGVEEN